MSLRFESLGDMPPKMREKAAAAMAARAAGQRKAIPPEGSGKGKYGNIPTELNGIRFDSAKEARRYEALMLAKSMGVIGDLRLQEDFTLQEAYTQDNGERVRAIRYRADFTYLVLIHPIPKCFLSKISPEDMEFWESWWTAHPGERVVEDVKSKATKTKAYTMKKKLLAQRFGISIREV